MSAGSSFAQQPAPPLTDELLQRYGAMCQAQKDARAGKAQSMAAVNEAELDALARQHGFSGQEEIMELGMRIAMVDMYAPEDPDAQAMLKSVTDPDMRSLIDRAQGDAPLVQGNAEALKACKAG